MKHKLMIALFGVMSCLCIASTAMSVTYAWFTFGAELELGNINVKFDSDPELKISLDGKNKKDELSYQELQGTTNFYPVSSMYTSDWLKPNAEKPILKTGFSRGAIDNPTSYRKPNDALSGFFQRELYLHADRDIAATIDPESVKLVPNVKANELTAKDLKDVYSDKSHDEIVENLNRIAKTTRISVYVPGEDPTYVIIDPNKENDDTYLCGRMSMNSGLYYDYYAKEDEDFEFVYGECLNEDKIVYDDAKENDSELVGAHTVFNAKTRAGVKAFNMEKSIANGFVPKIEDSHTPSEACELITIPLKRNVPSKIVVTIYIEGWDKDNVAETMLGSFLAGIKFKLAEGRV